MAGDNQRNLSRKIRPKKKHNTHMHHNKTNSFHVYSEFKNTVLSLITFEQLYTVYGHCVESQREEEQVRDIEFC